MSDRSQSDVIADDMLLNLAMINVTLFQTYNAVILLRHGSRDIL